MSDHNCRDHVVRTVLVKGAPNPQSPLATSGDDARYHCSVCKKPLHAGMLFKSQSDVLMQVRA